MSNDATRRTNNSLCACDMAQAVLFYMMKGPAADATDAPQP